MKYELYKKYKKLIYKVMKDLHCSWKTDDEFQAIYDAGEIGLLRAINKVDIENINTSFFYTSIRHAITNHFTNKTRLKRYLDGTDMLCIEEIDISSNVNIEEQVIINDQKEKLIKAFKELKPKYQDVLYKYYILNKTIYELAKELGVSHQNIWTIKQSALKKLKEKLKE